MSSDLKDKIIKVLKKIPDPELGVSVWDLGLIYDIKINKGKGLPAGRQVEILMTLTSVGCPLFSEIEESIKKEIKKIKGVEKVIIDLTFEPVWSIEKMSSEAKAQLGI